MQCRLLQTGLLPLEEAEEEVARAKKNKCALSHAPESRALQACKNEYRVSCPEWVLG